MFSVTALGHQGWLVGAARTQILIDPVLTPRFTRLPLSAPEVFPPRDLDLTALPPIDAVLLSHEHPDHLDLASLQHLDRRIPIYLSGHASEAARRVIASLGFEVRPLDPGRPCHVGELGVLPLPPYVIGEPGENEVDIVPILIRDRDGHGNFFTSVDIVQTPEMAQEVRRHLDRPGIWTHANNAFAQGAFFEWSPAGDDPVSKAARQLATRYVSLFEGWGHPEITLVNGDGATLGRDLAPLNPHVFDVSSEALVARVKDALPEHRFEAVTPGTTAEMRDGELVAVRSSTPFLSAAPRARWPERGGAPFPDGRRPDFPPGTGKTTLDPAGQARLERALADFGRFLFARATYRGLYRLMAERHHPLSLRSTLALVLRDGEAGAAQVWEYQPQRSAFVRVACDNPRATYVAGGEFWASDLLAALTFEAFADDLFHFGRKRLWNAAPGVFRCDLDTEIQLFAHPLRALDESEALYRRCLAVDPPVLVRARREDERPAPGPAGPLPRREPRLRPVPAAIAAPSPELPRTPPKDPVPEATAGRLRQAVEAASGGEWTFDSAGLAGAGVRASFVLPDRSLLTLDATPASATPRHYKKIGALAFSYSPASTPPATLGVLDRVIAAVAAVLTTDAPEAR